MEDFYQVELSADQNSTRNLNTSVNGIVPVPLSYKMCLNGSNNTGNISNLPDFNVTVKLNNNTGLFRSDIGLFRFSPFMSPGDSFDVSAKDPWNDTINNHGNYTFSALVDNQQLNINLAARINSSLSLNASNITYGDNASINATLTDSNGSILSNRAIIFNINGNNYTFTTTNITDGSGVDVLVDNISGLHAGSYNVSASFNGDTDYNPSTNNITFNVGKRDTSLNITKTVNSTAPVVVGDLVNYTIKVMNNGTNNISTPILVNDTLSNGLEYVNSNANAGAGSYNSSTGLWNITAGLNRGDNATLNISVRVKTAGNLINNASLVLGDYNNNQTMIPVLI